MDQSNNNMASGDVERNLATAAELASGKKGLPRWIKGCGIGCLGFIILIVGTVLYARSYMLGKIDSVRQEALSAGYATVENSEIRITKPITQKTYYQASIVEIEQGAQTDISIVAETCKLSGVFKGKVQFNGGMLLLDESVEIAELTGNVVILVNVGKVVKKDAWIYHEQNTLPKEMEQSYDKQYGAKEDKDGQDQKGQEEK